MCQVYPEAVLALRHARGQDGRPRAGVFAERDRKSTQRGNGGGSPARRVGPLPTLAEQVIAGVVLWHDDS